MFIFHRKTKFDYNNNFILSLYNDSFTKLFGNSTIWQTYIYTDICMELPSCKYHCYRGCCRRQSWLCVRIPFDMSLAVFLHILFLIMFDCLLYCVNVYACCAPCWSVCTFQLVSSTKGTIGRFMYTYCQIGLCHHFRRKLKIPYL